MSETVLTIYKQLAETPLSALKRARGEHHISPEIPMTYAGRLDPMAEGLLLILVGDECKNKEQYLGLSKTYEFKILVGLSTDTHDLLGITENVSSKEVFVRSSDLLSRLTPSAGQTVPTISFDSTLQAEISFPDYTEQIQRSLNQFTGTFIQKYPSFSSKTIDGKQLFQLSKDDELPEILPEHEITIEKLEITHTEIISKEALHTEILRRIALVEGDFRQAEIIQKWNEVFVSTTQQEFLLVSCTAECSSGTYIRQLVSDISEKIGHPLVTYSIKRTVVGGYSL